jgi:hypothetical protein
VAVEVVPSLQVVGAAAASAAAVCIPSVNTVKDTARNPARFVLFMDLLPGYSNPGLNPALMLSIFFGQIESALRRA